MSADLVIRNGTILDGAGGDPFVADVLVENDRIAEIGSLSAVEAPEIDATGLFVAPGFIDIHSHSDYTLLVDPRAVSAVHQGVTLEVIGNCGHGCFPCLDPALATQRRSTASRRGRPLDAGTRAAGYFDAARRAQPRRQRAQSRAERTAPALDRRAGAAGRRGTSSRADGASCSSRRSTRAPGATRRVSEYAAEASVPAEEIEVLCRTAARRGVFYAPTRERDDGADRGGRGGAANRRQAGVRLRSRTSCPRGGLDRRGAAWRSSKPRRPGDRTSRSTCTPGCIGFTYLASVLPAWVFDDGPDGVVERLSDRNVRERMKAHRSILSAGGDWSRVVLLDNSHCPEYARRDFAAIAAERGQEPLDAIFDLLRDAGDKMQQLEVIIHAYSEEEQTEAFAHPLCMPGSDATTLAPDGRLAGSMFHGAYTWAAWFYRFMVRDKGLLTPTQAVNRLTGLPAERFGLQGRGLLRAGLYADLAIFDPSSFAETGTTFEPNQLATGMRHVVVNGVLTLKDGALTGDRAGAVLRRAGA